MLDVRPKRLTLLNVCWPQSKAESETHPEIVSTKAAGVERPGVKPKVKYVAAAAAALASAVAVVWVVALLAAPSPQPSVAPGPGQIGIHEELGHIYGGNQQTAVVVVHRISTLTRMVSMFRDWLTAESNSVNRGYRTSVSERRSRPEWVLCCRRSCTLPSYPILFRP